MSNSSSFGHRPLEGVTVLDLSRVLAGPYCTLILADLGARVIKIELPGSGDDSRQFGPFLGKKSAYFMSINRNKESVALDLKHERGLEIAKKLAKKCDVLVENFRPGTAERLGLSYNDLAKENPSLIYASISGFGQDGPWKGKPAYDIIIQGLSGMMSITGHPGSPPTRVGMSLADIGAGMFAATGIVSALYERTKSKTGQHIDVSMLESQIAMLENAVARYLVQGEIPGPLGSRHPSITPFAAFQSKDGYVLVGIGNDNLWRQFLSYVGENDLADDPRFLTNRLRTENLTQLEPILNKIFAQRTTAEWLDFLERKGIPCGPVNTIDKVIREPQVVARQTLVGIDHPGSGVVRMPRAPIRMSRTDPNVYEPAPELGEDTEKVLKELGYSEDEIAELINSGAVAVPPCP